MSKKICLILGVGPGNGLAFINQFTGEDYHVIAISRSSYKLAARLEDPSCVDLYNADLMKKDEIDDLLDKIISKYGPIDTLVYNAGNAVLGNVHQITLETFQQAWHLNTLACLQVIQKCLPAMQAEQKGNIIIIGATASLRASAGFLAFASAKAAQRSMAESIAKEVAKDKIHVAYIIVDGVIDMPTTREYFSDKEDEFFVQPKHIAQTVYQLTQQQPSAWSFQLDLRPFSESW